jgi:hypothetical protein
MHWPANSLVCGSFQAIFAARESESKQAVQSSLANHFWRLGALLAGLAEISAVARACLPAAIVCQAGASVRSLSCYRRASEKERGGRRQRRPSLSISIVRRSHYFDCFGPVRLLISWPVRVRGSCRHFLPKLRRILVCKHGQMVARSHTVYKTGGHLITAD